MTGELSISCNKNNLKVVRSFLQNELFSIFNAEELNLVILCIDEICANIIIHEQEKTLNRKLKVSYNLNLAKQTITFTIKHRGNHFNYDSYKEPQLNRLISEKKKGGIGLLLVTRIMDSVKCEQLSKYCITTLSKKINRLNPITS
jgi:serine/threonine-protein kinase RsbW